MLAPAAHPAIAAAPKELTVDWIRVLAMPNMELCIAEGNPMRSMNRNSSICMRSAEIMSLYEPSALINSATTTLAEM